jgi:hypothetical protein
VTLRRFGEVVAFGVGCDLLIYAVLEQPVHCIDCIPLRYHAAMLGVALMTLQCRRIIRRDDWQLWMWMGAGLLASQIGVIVSGAAWVVLIAGWVRRAVRLARRRETGG